MDRRIKVMQESFYERPLIEKPESDVRYFNETLSFKAPVNATPFDNMEKLITQLKQPITLQVFTISLRYLLGSAFVYASISKIQGTSFIAESSASVPIATVSGVIQGLLESGLYGQFVGWGQLIAGFLLMSQVFSTLGAIAFYPIMLNIFMITISFESSSIPILTGLMLTANSYLLLWDWHKLKFIVLPSPQRYIDNTAEFSKRRVWTYLGVFYFITIILIRNVVISNQLVDRATIVNPAFSMSLVLVAVLSMLMLWVITIIFQLLKR